jgi:hypothetical protein
LLCSFILPPHVLITGSFKFSIIIRILLQNNRALSLTVPIGRHDLISSEIGIVSPHYKMVTLESKGDMIQSCSPYRLSDAVIKYGETFIEFLRKWYEVVIPVKTGIQYFQVFLDSRLRGNDKEAAFFKGLIMSPDYPDVEGIHFSQNFNLLYINH